MMYHKKSFIKNQSEDSICSYESVNYFHDNCLSIIIIIIIIIIVIVIVLFVTSVPLFVYIYIGCI